MDEDRVIDSRYQDPLTLVWMSTARRLGLHVRRNRSIYSATDGTGLLELGPLDTLDPDDTTGQMIFHEICHWITNGVETYHEEDWGFPLDDADDPREFACLRVQAALADRHGLRGMFGPTGVYRAYFDQIPSDPFAPRDASDAEAAIVAIARTVWSRVDHPPFAPHVHDALAATARVVLNLDEFITRN